MISKPPIKTFVQYRFQPSMEERMMEGAKTLIPVERPRCKRKRNEVNALVLLSNLFSRYS
jgi:hypothetical protein